MSGKLLTGGVLVLGVCLWNAGQTHAASTGVVISQVYGGGGSLGATFRNDFIELHNRGASAVSLSGWTIQYADSNNWQTTFLGGVLQPGQYYLIQQAGGATGANLPTSDASSSINLGASAGKVALVNNFTTLSGTCPTGGQIVDFVGYGSANCFEANAAPSASSTIAVLRNNNGCSDTDNNAADFTASAPNPRNTGASFVTCVLPTPVFTAYHRAANGVFSFQFTADPARSNVVQFSTNLTSWNVLTTALNQVGNTFSGADTNPAPRRMYRVWSP